MFINSASVVVTLRGLLLSYRDGLLVVQGEGFRWVQGGGMSWYREYAAISTRYRLLQ
jgi:hypothetical protein